jgi:hypothetical protein
VTLIALFDDTGALMQLVMLVGCNHIAAATERSVHGRL